MQSLTLTTYSNGKTVRHNLDMDDVLCDIETTLGDHISYHESGRLQTPDRLVNMGFTKNICYFDSNKGCIKARVRGRWYTWYVSNDMTEYTFDRLTDIM